MMRKTAFPALCTLLLTACQHPTPKPMGQLRLTYPKAAYTRFSPNDCPFSFEKSRYAKAEKADDHCWYTLHYPAMRASLYLTYKDVSGDYDKLIQDVEKLTYRHSIKATYITDQPYVNAEHKVYGMLFHVGGPAASNLQFYASDSTHHLLSGSLYFYTTPNPDSLRPAVQYLEKDIKHLMESLRWKR